MSFREAIIAQWNYRPTPAVTLTKTCRVTRLVRGVGICSVFWGVFASGCYQWGGTPDRAEAENRRTGQSPTPGFPLSGRVTIDGASPALRLKRNAKLVVVLTSPPKKEGEPVEMAAYTECKSDGQFSFQSVGDGDGIPAGQYVIAFAGLIHNRRGGYRGPDGLQNLYNDPMRNLQNPEFRIEHAAPGKTDYLFELKLDDQEEVKAPSSQALTKIEEE